MRDMSNKSAKARMSKATDALEYIKNSIASGKTVYVTAGNRTTKVTPQAYAKWEASGKPLFKISSDGALLMASGSSYVRLTLADEMLARVTAMSRPGAKATFGSRRTTAGALRKQLKAQGMTDTADFEWHGISASDPDSTPYWLHEDGSMEKIKSSRPGAKAEMAIRSDNDIFDVLTEASDKGLDRHNLVREARRLRDAIDPHGVGGQAMLKHKSWPQLVRLAEQIERLPAAYARTGAKVTAEKATMAAPTPHKVTVTDKSGTARTYMVSDRVLRSIEGTKKQAEARGTAPAYDDVIRLGTKMGEVVEASKAKAEKPSDLEREDVKAGLKLMEKADKAVSDKIRTLIKEGKPQDQAVAIALDMKRRGEI